MYKTTSTLPKSIAAHVFKNTSLYDVTRCSFWYKNGFSIKAPHTATITGQAFNC
ncbi:hypothetical protein EVA_16696 [gut metagenome]|uniref:Uncharacterized protein n=1 Tax=gut metagenome TaxID=749906 RepID=J9G081_9ZZZZ